MPGRNGRRNSLLRARSPSSRMWESGDAIYDTPEMKAERAALRHDAGVRSALDEWWDATDVDNNGQIDRAEYLELGKALYRVMIADGDEAAAQSSAEDDWAEDSRGHAVMSGDHFRDAIFQLADLWTDGLEPETYVAFLRDLLPKMQAAGLGRGKWRMAASAHAPADICPPVTIPRFQAHKPPQPCPKPQTKPGSKPPDVA